MHTSKTSVSWGDAVSHCRGTGKPVSSSKTRTAQFSASTCLSRWPEWFHCWLLASSWQKAGVPWSWPPCIGANEQPVPCHRSTISSERCHFNRFLLPPSPKEKLLPVLNVVVTFYTHGQSGTAWVCRQRQASEHVHDTAVERSGHLPGSRGLAPWTVLAPCFQQLLVKMRGQIEVLWGYIHACLQTHIWAAYGL